MFGDTDVELDGARVDGKDQLQSELLDLREVRLEHLRSLPDTVFTGWLRCAVAADADPESGHTGFQSQI